MSFWSSRTIKRRVMKESLITPYFEDSVKHCAYEMHLGCEYFATGNGKDVKQQVHWNQQIVVRPGQFALLLTSERIKIPKDAIGMISIKAGIKFKGLVNVSGFHVDPGYNGKIIFSVYNAGSQKIVLTRDEPYFLLWFCNLDSPTGDLYDGKKNGNGITDEYVTAIQGHIASPAELNSRVKLLESKIKIGTWLGGAVCTLLITIIGAFISGIVPSLISSSTK